MVKILRGLLPTALAIVLGIGSTFISRSVQLDVLVASMQEVKSSNEKMSKDLKDMKVEQEALYKSYYLPTRLEWQTHTAMIQKISVENEDTRRAVVMLREDINRLHDPNNGRARNDGQRKY